MGKHATHRMHENSLLIDDALMRRREQILGVYDRADRPLTDREVANALGFPCMNMVRPTITVLIEDRTLTERGSTKCKTTGRTVRVVGRL